jgi:hypothetical protein
MVGWLRLARIALCAAAGTAAIAHVARAQAAPPLRPSELVTLTAQQPGAGTCPLGGAAFQQISSSSQLSPFVAPPKRVLVITAIQLVVNDAGPLATSVLITAQSATEEQLLTTSAVTVDAGGDGGGSIVLPSGLRAPPGRTVCLRSGAPIAGGYLHGYLARDK